MSLALEAAAKLSKLISAAVSSRVRAIGALKLEKVGASFTGVSVNVPAARALGVWPLSITCHSMVRVLLLPVGLSLLLA